MRVVKLWYFHKIWKIYPQISLITSSIVPPVILLTRCRLYRTTGKGEQRSTLRCKSSLQGVCLVLCLYTCRDSSRSTPRVTGPPAISGRPAYIYPTRLQRHLREPNSKNLDILIQGENGLIILTPQDFEVNYNGCAAILFTCA